MRVVRTADLADLVVADLVAEQDPLVLVDLDADSRDVDGPPGTLPGALLVPSTA